VKIEISPRALREIERKAASWAQHSTLSPGLFWDELVAAGRRLLMEPYAGRRWISAKGRVMLRLLLERTQNHLYYTYEPDKELIRVWCLWGARRGREPRL
jgi:plasmid stabilization system protein ParE